MLVSAAMRFTTVAVWLAVAGVAHADDLVLHAQDSITIDGQRYTCADPSRRGVQLGAGDRVTAGKYKLRCVADDAPPPPPDAAADTIAVTSVVEPTCIDALNNAVSGHPPAADALGWAGACRTVDVRACQIKTQQPDATCFSRLESVISGSFSASDGAAAERACQRVEATCPSHPNKAAARVDLACLDQLYRGTPGKPSPASVLNWIASCRNRTTGHCTVVGGSFDAACVTKAYQMVTGKLSPPDAGAVARACRATDLRCD